MKTKWRIDIEKLKSFRFSEDGKIYRLPYTKGLKSYGWRLIKMQHPNRWRLDGVWWSKNQIKNHLIRDDDPLTIYTEGEMPF